MKLIVGLGNPGIFYGGSRHNIGFITVKALARENRAALKKNNSCFSLSAAAKTGSRQLLLAMPLTFMNLSGLAVKALLDKYKIALSDLLVVCDDLDLEFGRLKIRPSGSSAGHRGLKSIIDSVGSSQFCRLRIGIGRPPQGTDTAKYVLSPFSRKEKKDLGQITQNAAACCVSWLESGIEETMNIFNSRSKT